MRFQFLLLSVATAVAAVSVGGCSGFEKKIDDKVAQEKPATQPGELASRGFEAWASSSNIDLDQKSKLWTVQASTAREAMRIRSEITMAKSAMFKELAKGDFNTKLVDGFKKKIVKLDQERLNLMFAALDKVEDILGKGPNRREYYLYLEEMETRGFEGR